VACTNHPQLAQSSKFPNEQKPERMCVEVTMMSERELSRIEDKLNVALIEIIGSATFFIKFANVLEKFIPSESFTILLYHKNAAPIKLAWYKGKLKYDAGLSNYLNYTYVIHPIYRAYQKGLKTGVYLISDLIGADNKEVIDLAEYDIRIENTELIGYRTPGWPKNFAECVTLINSNCPGCFA
jgi:hypothetical protein